MAAAEAVRLDLVRYRFALDGASRTAQSGGEVAVDVSSDVLFAFGSAELTSKAQFTLQAVAAELKERATGPVQILGHTDTVGAGREPSAVGGAGAHRCGRLAAADDRVDAELVRARRDRAGRL